MKNSVVSFVLFLMFWLLINASFSFDYILAGVFVSAAVSFWVSKKIQYLTDVNFSLKAFKALALFVLVVLKDYIISNIEMALITVSKDIKIFPGIVSFRTNLKNPVARMILSNTISFIPATLTVDIKRDTLYIHSIEAGKEGSEKMITRAIRKYEKYLKEIYG